MRNTRGSDPACCILRACPSFALKLLLAPGFVVGASLTARRFGPRVGGLVGGLPVVAGPILLVIAILHGEDFGADASAASNSSG